MAPKILVVDDEASTRLLLKAMLQKQYILFFAKNGMEGLDILGQNPDISLVITDIFMPLVDGFQMTEQVRAGKNPFQGIPVLIMSAFGERRNINRARTIKATGWLNKPLSKDEVIPIVTGLVRP